MATAQLLSAFQELADFFASAPSRDKILEFRPSKALQRQAQQMLSKQDRGLPLTEEEQRQLDEMLQAELIVRLVKAKVRGLKGPSS